MIPKLVIFDCDGVVVDSEHITNKVMRDDLAMRGLVLDLDQIMDLFVGGTIAGCAIQAAKMGADIPDDWVPMMYDKFFKALAEQAELVPGILTVLDALDVAGVPYAMGSNGPHKKMQITLGRTGIKDRFQGRIYSREDVPNPKPAPDVYLHAARLAGVGPQDCVVVEDSVSGAKAGVAAGMRTLGFTRDTPVAKLRPIVDQVFSDMSELPALLGLTPQ
ncbi:MAG: HAD family hydrolase [Planktomarina sp.]